MADYTELKRLAEAATQGQWSSEQGNLFWHEDGYTKHLMETFDGSDLCHDGEHPANLNYIAAANPAAVQALIAENERLREGPHMRAIRSLRGDCADLMAERDQLKAATATPESVFLNMKSGALPKPTIRSMVDLYGDVVNGDEAQLLEIARLRGENEALRKDAERYHFIRNKDAQHLDPAEADAQIDAAMGKAVQP